MAQKKFEDMVERLEKIVDEMESGSLGLDDALKYYEEGITLMRACYKKLEEAEKKIEKLVKKKGAHAPDEYETQPLDMFENEENA
ncbi:MAG: exodeoxyribonuclease VII small subunit [Candidatus Raymondbacteria bacterium RifOxyA12_full_50_37]|uniref:Exodeoxyribonuclease 7 small subunit n=1 Tax=Candidatus Raymondbacteria bacterium RIFOXYD12_FULL_49_13 TaxID=1817890 RepID=A0A1F7F195_UNCRA|nr:MAG: exodeoxyribonuclease VII small subunit [Candidatus Raymondbacteria bacterium RifOxyA12_full_50_37]OGJ93936.1 MAG: exodeoxyribonuclease VII small subunit [Candidatus Raymondbacteria bacterium RIFOXYA2_FULL_49_16]OGJ94714.1 MAG: exodeoxyribonuclease VII small subunit [Candidatus Raymondbacteria bacterium RifOxyC12_full_50_8]OGJ98195.1 MAG: exodeoxyribonuclease VII small subunit [Candidatus Raymondbacteria bacterium RIFOXYC2_FULL_50_21]OGK00429.1 MAG: exodeoxyribonuclease VII small subunit